MVVDYTIDLLTVHICLLNNRPPSSVYFYNDHLQLFLYKTIN